MNRLLTIVLLWISTGVCLSPTFGAEATSEQEIISVESREAAVAALREALEVEQKWIKVHAAEFLLGLSYPLGVYETFEAERVAHENEPQYRIGIWRVLSQSATSPQEREEWVARIRAIVMEPQATDRTHALESLAKLGDTSSDPKYRDAIAEATQAGKPTAPCALWLLSRMELEEPGESKSLSELLRLVDSDDATSRLISAYALLWLRTQEPRIGQLLLKSNLPIGPKLCSAAEREPRDSPARMNLLAAAWQLSEDLDQAVKFKTELMNLAESGDSSARIAAAAGLAERGGKQDISTLSKWREDPNGDVRASAAACVLRIGRRVSHRLSWLDWSVMGLYGAGMLAVGCFYSFRTSTSDEYLLGGRRMSPWMVGLSLFATLCSTISYLSTPGEIIQHGPMFLMSVAAYPVITMVVGWWLIPYFMRLPVTSAYEILETRLGLGVRMLGATFFLAMRLLWMAVILNVTTKVVLLPLLGLNPSHGPMICAILGLSTVIYSSMGGIRAVVMTDVIQTFILLGGALVSLGLITWSLGGVSGWWPTAWAANWDPPALGFDPSARMSVIGIIMSTFFWYVCTAGSDQMAIQRYLSTRDVRAARRMFGISMVSGVVVMVLLSFLGMALLAWFQAHPEQLGEHQTVARSGDQLFPRFILASLPEGASGLVIAGLLAAAMSSLSSGLSSSCAVLSVDYFDRFSSHRLTPAGEVRRARLISWAIGFTVVLLSSVVGMVQGNVLDLAYKVVNLLVAPLFGLFFMALFVRWATSFGTFAGAVSGVTTVVLINYWTEFTGQKGISFLWSMPLGLLIQIGVGSIISLLPIGTSKPFPESN